MTVPEQVPTVELSRSVAEIRRAPIVVQDELVIFDTGKFEQMQRIASAMAEMKLMPAHLQKSAADCLLVVEQAWRWRMSPTAVASKSYSVGGKLAYEGQLVAAVINSSGILAERLNYVYEGSFIEGAPEPKKVTRSVWVIGHIRGEREPRKIELWWKDGHAASKGARDKWLSQPDQMLAYAGARIWARRHVPELLLGVYEPDELQEEGARMRDVTPLPPRPTRESVAALAAAPAETEASPEEAAEAEAANAALDREAAAAINGTVDTSDMGETEPADEAPTESEDPAPQAQSANVGPILPPPGARPNWGQWNRSALDLVKAASLKDLAQIDHELRHTPNVPPAVASAVANSILGRRKQLGAGK